MSSSDSDDLHDLREELTRLGLDMRAIAERFSHLEDALRRQAAPAPPRDARQQVPSLPQPSEPAEEPLLAEVISAEVIDEAWKTSDASFPVARKSETAPDRSVHWEVLVGGRWLTWIGAAVLLVAVTLSIHWAWKTLDTPDWLKVAMFHLLGVGLLAAGYWQVRRRLVILAEALAGLGIFTLYASGFASIQLYDIWPAQWESTIVFAEGILITVLAITVALRANSIVVILLGGLGGYLTPIIVSTGSGQYVVMFTYLAMLNVALLACAVLRGWSFLKPLALVATAAMFAVSYQLMLQKFGSDVVWPFEWLAVLHASIFLIGTTLPPCLWRRESDRFDLFALSANSLGFLGMTWYLFHERTEQQLAMVSWGMALLHLGLFAATYLRVTNIDRMPRIHLALAAVFFTLAIPLQLDDVNYLGVTWCIEGLVFTAVGVYFRDRQLGVSALVVLALGALRLVAYDLIDAPRPLGETGIDGRFVVIAVSGAITMLAGSLYWALPLAAGTSDRPDAFERAVGGLLLAAGNVCLLAAVTCQWESRLVIVIWALDAAIVWAISFARDLEPVRWYALGVGVLLVGGCAIHHGDNVPDPFALLTNARFASLACVAVLYFGAGWSYRRMRLRQDPPSDPGQNLELLADPLLGVLANAALVIALTLEVHDWFYQAAARDWQPFKYMRMAQEASYSVLWAVYAAGVVVAGFLLRYRLFRLLGLLAFGPIIAKVFLVDLSGLELLPRMLAFAVLGIMLLGISFLYQRFTPRIDLPE